MNLVLQNSNFEYAQSQLYANYTLSNIISYNIYIIIYI